MATGAKVESFLPKTSASSAAVSGGFKGSISKLSASSLAELCQRLRVQLIQQRLPLICPACRPNLVRAFNMELNLTQMLRGFCKTCKTLFMAGPSVAAASKPVFPKKLIKSLDSSKAVLSVKIKKVVLKISGKSRPGSSLKRAMNSAEEVSSHLLESSSPGKIVRTARSLSEPVAISGKRRYAKQFDIMGRVPLTPPPTPARAGRKRRATADLSSEVLVCFEPDAIIKRPPSVKPVVFTPSFRIVQYPPAKPLTHVTHSEALLDPVLATRHERYEEVEKTMRLCRPEVLRSLYSGSPDSSANVSITSSGSG